MLCGQPRYKFDSTGLATIRPQSAAMLTRQLASGCGLSPALASGKQRIQCCKRASQNARQVATRAAGEQTPQPSNGVPNLLAISRRMLVGGGLLTAGAAGAALAGEDRPRVGERIVHTDDEWRALLTPGQYKILRQAGTELPTTSPLNNEKRRGKFVCAGCGTPVFSSEAKYNSGTGWPSFFEPLDGAVAETVDASIPFMVRTEVRCKSCGGHLGHVFDDGPPPTGLRYCMNGLAMNFQPAEQAPQV